LKTIVSLQRSESLFMRVPDVMSESFKTIATLQRSEPREPRVPQTKSESSIDESTRFSERIRTVESNKQVD